MTAKNGTPVRFSLLTVIVWLLVAAGIIFILWQAIKRISATQLPSTLLTQPDPGTTDYRSRTDRSAEQPDRSRDDQRYGFPYSCFDEHSIQPISSTTRHIHRNGPH